MWANARNCLWQQVSSEILWYQPPQDPLLSTVHPSVRCYCPMHQVNSFRHFNTAQKGSVHKMLRGDVMASLHNVEHNKRVFFLLSVHNTGHHAQVVILLLCATGNTSTGFEGNIQYHNITLKVWNDCKKATSSLCPHGINYKSKLFVRVMCAYM